VSAGVLAFSLYFSFWPHSRIIKIRSPFADVQNLISSVLVFLCQEVAPAPQKPSKPATPAGGKKKNLAAPAPSATPISTRLSPAQHAAKWQLFKQKNPRKRYASAAAEQRAFATFQANRARIAQQNDRVATVLNPKPFNSAGPLADVPPAVFQAKYLTARRPKTGAAAARGKAQTAAPRAPTAGRNAAGGKARFMEVDAEAEAENEMETELDAEAEADAEADAEAEAEAETDAEAEVDEELYAQLVEMATELNAAPRTGAGKAAGSSGGTGGSSGGTGGSSGGTGGHAGGRGGSSGGTGGSSGGTGGSSGGTGGSSGGTGGSSGGTGGSSGGTGGSSGGTGGSSGGTGGSSGGTGGSSGGTGGSSGGTGGNSGGVIVSPENLIKKLLQTFKGYAFNNGADKTDSQRICRVVATMWFKRYADSALKRIWQFGVSAGAVFADPTKLCTMSAWVTEIHPSQALIRQAYAELTDHPSRTPFINPVSGGLHHVAWTGSSLSDCSSLRCSLSHSLTRWCPPR
jgi:hypothetical protein